MSLPKLQNFQTANALSRALYDLAKATSFEHTVKLEYPKKSDSFVERMTIRLVDTDEENTREFTIQITEYESKVGTKQKNVPVEIVLEIEDEDDGEDDFEFSTYDEVYAHVLQLVGKKNVASVPPAAGESKYGVRLNQYAVTQGIQVTQVAWLDINTPNSTGGIVVHQVPIAFVENALHIADMTKFLHALGFGEQVHNVYSLAKHTRLSRITKALTSILGGRPLTLHTVGGLVHETQGNHAVVFQMRMDDGRILNGVIPTVRPVEPDVDDDEEEEEEDNE